MGFSPRSQGGGDWQIGGCRGPFHGFAGGAFFCAVLALALFCRGTLAAQPEKTGRSGLFPPELVEFTPYSGNPVFAGRGDAAWDAAIRERGWILREGNQWRLWYTGYDGSRQGIKKLGYATSEDGLKWKRHDAPLYDGGWVEDVNVVRDGDVYYMFAEGAGDQAQLLTSPDGLRWERRGKLDIRYTDGRPLSPGPFGTPVAWREAQSWYLLYERMDKGIWLAASKDLSKWTHVQDEPVMVPAPEEHGAIAFDQVIKRGGRYYAYYHALDDPDKRTWSTNIASSEDLRNWTRFSGNPILRENQSSPMVVDDGRGLRLYTMHPQVNVHFATERDKDR